MQSLVAKARKRRRVFDDREMARQSWAGKDFFASWLPEAMDLYVGEGLRERSDGQVELKCSPDVEAAIFLSGPRFDVWGAAERVPTPTLLVWAERGDFPRLVYEGVAARMPDATIHDVPGGHLLPMERPDLVVDEVLAFTGAGQGSVG